MARFSSSLHALVATLAAGTLACGGTLVDHRGGGILGDAASCGGGQVVCGGACTTQSAAACGASCSPCTSAPADAVASCTPTGAGGHDGACDFVCDAGLLRCGSGCCAPALVAAGGAFSCAATTTGDVHCFGAGDVGQLGDGATVDRATSARLGGFSSPVSALVAGDAHACALSGGATLCWGNGAAFGSGGAVLDPQPVASLAGATTISAGASHTCGIFPGGAVLCVGAAPEAGGGSPALGGAALAIAAGFDFTCALVDAGAGTSAVKCWGADGFGQLGDAGAAGAAATPVTVAVPGTMTLLAAGARHACAGAPTSDSQTLFCWGSNASRQLGADASGTGIFGPVRNTRVQKPVVAVAAGGHATCAVENDNGFVPQCWSSDPLVAAGAHLDGQPNLLPTAPSTGPPIVFSAGAAHTCFVDPVAAPARLECFGTGARGRLGNGSVGDSATPVLAVDR